MLTFLIGWSTQMGLWRGMVIRKWKRKLLIEHWNGLRIMDKQAEGKVFS